MDFASSSVCLSASTVLMSGLGDPARTAIPIADQVLSKSRLIGGGERVGAVVARGGAELGFQQISELLPVPGIAHITPLPPEVQKVSIFSAGVAASTSDSDLAHSVIKFLASPEAANAITKSGLEAVANR